MIHIQHEAHKDTTKKDAQTARQNLEKSLKILKLKSYLELDSKQKLHTTLLLDIHWIYWNQNQALKPPK